jgi:geranylgeranyl diphosphate synthase, type II
LPSAIQKRSRASTTADCSATVVAVADSSERIKLTPPLRSVRERLRRRATQSAAELDATRPLEKGELELLARGVLAELALPVDFLGWTMVMLASAAWRAQVMAVPHNRRLLLLPRDLIDGGEFSARARILGYQLLAVEQSEAVLGALLEGDVDAIVGLASLDLLEKAIDHILWLGIPCLGLPLFDAASGSNGSAGESFDADWLLEMIDLPYVGADQAALTYVHLMRATRRIFDPEQLELLAPRTHRGPALAELNGDAATRLDPIAGTETIAYDFLARGGKHSRPFIVLAVHDAMTGGHGTRPGAHRHLAKLSEAIMRAALSIETFHKASLVHDDIEDDDPFRYGEPTLHRRFGVPVAINVGDYLIGLGYRLVSREAKSLGAEAVADILDRLAEAHLKLAEGQGAELLWRDSRDKRLSSQDALRIYALKTAPAFEAALLTGLRLAGPTEAYLEPIGKFARSLGTAFQIINDLGDWQPDRHNKLVAAGDVIGGRPTLLWALARESLSGKDLKRLEALAEDVPATEETVRQIGRLYRQAGVFDKAGDFVRQCELSAREVAEKLDPPELRRLLVYLIETVLKRPSM